MTNEVTPTPRVVVPTVVPTPASRLPAGVTPLVAADPLPTLGPDRLLLLASQPGGVVKLTGADGEVLEISEGVVATVPPDTFELPGGLSYDHTDLAELVESGRPGTSHPGQVVTRAADQGDFPHHEVWIVPTVATRVQLAKDASSIQVDWSDPRHQIAIVILDETASIVDVQTGVARPLGASVGSPSFAPDGTLYYRTLDGGAWRWTGTKGVNIGRGKRGTGQTGDLNVGIEPARYPLAVTFGKDGKPAFK